MIKRFISLERKQFFRSSYWQRSIGLKILMGFIGLWMIGSFLIMGFTIYPILKKVFPDQDPFIVVSGFLFYWMLGDLMMRFFLQKLPVMSVKPLLTLPIKRSQIVNYVLGKSAISFFNFLPLFAIIPFSIVLVFKEGYDGTTILFWVFTLIVITLITNFLNFIIESLTAKTSLSFLPLIVVSGSLFALNYFNIVSFSELISKGVLGITNNPILIVAPITILVGLYLYNFKILKSSLYIDTSLQAKIKEAKTTELAWTKRFGDIAPFMQLDLKLMMRNKRAKSTFPILVIGLLYGLFFYPQQYYDTVFMYAFIGIFSTGTFLINYGQFIPAWDSSYYKLLMSQNFKYEQYLKSKFTLMAISVVILFVLGIPYIYFGWKVLLAHFAAAIYNIGINTHVIMYGGSYNRKKINLDERAAFNFQGTGAVQWLIGLPLMVFPMIIFAAFNYFLSFEAAIAVLIVLGLLGIVFHQKIMKGIVNKYLSVKYKMIEAFSQDN